MFNQAQLPVLLAELGAHRDALRDPELRDVLAAMISVIEGAAGHVHVYVRFLGD